MATTDYRVIDHPGAWNATDFKGKDDLAIDLEPRHVAALRLPFRLGLRVHPQRHRLDRAAEAQGQ